MAVDSWLPAGFALPGGRRTRQAIAEGDTWQIYDAQGGGRLLVVRPDLAARWSQAGLVVHGELSSFEFGGESFFGLSSGQEHELAPLAEAKSPDNKNEALSFAEAFRATRRIDASSPLQDALYVEKLSKLLPTHSISAAVPDGVVFGRWLTGGVPVPVDSFRRLKSLLTWLSEPQLRLILAKAGFDASVQATEQAAVAGETLVEASGPKQFSLPGRPELEAFFAEHIIDIVEHAERYKALGIGFPAATILFGPTGTGKTFAVERLIEYLGWPSFSIDASSIGSPYIHETSRKVAEIFDKAMKSAPCVLVIDEMEAFLTDRQSGAGSSHHRVEEVAEFLRRIPEAIGNNVLLIAMTNHIEMIDSAVLRRGRFDHVIKVDFASEVEIAALLEKLLGELPCGDGIEVAPIAKRLHGRPLSDVAFVVREGARLSARSGAARLSQANLLRALDQADARGPNKEPRKIGFV